MARERERAVNEKVRQSGEEKVVQDEREHAGKRGKIWRDRRKKVIRTSGHFSPTLAAVPGHGLFVCVHVSASACACLCVYLSLSSTSVSLLIAEWTPRRLHRLYCDYHHLVVHPHRIARMDVV